MFSRAQEGLRRLVIQDDPAIREAEMRALTNMMAGDAKRIDDLAGDVGHLRGVIEGVDNKVDDVRDGIDKLASAMASVVRLEVHHEQQRADTVALRAAVEKIEGRVTLIETKIPSLLETRTWVLTAVGVVVLAVISALVALVVKTQ